MTSKTHNAIAFASLITIASYYPPENINLTTLAMSLVGVSVGSLIPDMDQAGNKLWSLFPGGSSFGKIFRKVFYKHRTITHSLVGTFLIYKGLEFVFQKLMNPQFLDPKILLFSVMIGYVSHLLADSFTEEGLPLFFPFKFTFGIPPIKRVRIKTGQWFENFVVLPATWIYVIFFLQYQKDTFLEILKKVVN